MGMKSDRREILEIMATFDDNGDGLLDQQEFTAAFETWLHSHTETEYTGLLPPQGSEASFDHVWNSQKPKSEDDDDNYLNEDDSSLVKDAAFQLTLGTLVVLLFSDPMIDAIQAFGLVTGIPAFFVSFVVVPMASNAAELISACQFASKKTVDTATVGIATCYGAACMNNTLCLGVFFLLIYSRGLKWTFFAETIGLLTCISLLGILGQKTQFKLIDCFVIGGTYFGSIIIIAVGRVLFNES